MADPVDSEETPVAEEASTEEVDTPKSDFELRRQMWTGAYAESVTEAPGKEVTAEELLQAGEKARAKRSAATAEIEGDTEQIKNLKIDYLLADIKKGQELVSSGRNLPGYGSTNQILDKHAKSLGYTTEEYRELINQYEIGLDGMITAASSTQKSPEEILEEYRKYNPYLGSEKEREAYKNRAKTHEERIQSYADKGEELPHWLVKDRLEFDDETSFGGTDISELEEIAKEGQTAHMAATIRADSLMADPKIARYVRELEYKNFGGERYYDFRVMDLLDRYKQLNPGKFEELNSDELLELKSRIATTTMTELATLKTVGLWTAPIFLRKSRLSDTTWGFQSENPGWFEALSPRIEVVGIHRLGRGRTTVIRQEGAMDTTFRIADAPKSAAVGALTHDITLEGARRGVAEGYQAMDVFQDFADKEDLGTFLTSALLFSGTVIDVGAPGLEIVPGVTKTAGAKTVKGAAAVRTTARFLKDVEPALLAYKNKNPLLFNKLNLELSGTYSGTNTIKEIDSMQSELTPFMAKSNPDILDTELADSLPGEAGELQVNLAPDYRKLRSKKYQEVKSKKTEEGTAATEPVTPVTTARGKESVIDDFERNIKAIDNEKGKLQRRLDDIESARSKKNKKTDGLSPEAKALRASLYAGQLDKKIIKFGDAAEIAATKAAEDSSAGAKLRKQIKDTLPSALENPDAWLRNMIGFVSEELPGLERSALRPPGKPFAKFIKEEAAELSEAEIAEIKRRRAARNKIRGFLVQMNIEAKKLNKKIDAMGKDEAAQIKKQLALLERARKAVQTNMETRAAALYLVYGKEHGRISIFGRRMGVKKMRRDILDTKLIDDLEEYAKLTPHAVYFANEVYRVFLSDFASEGEEAAEAARSQSLMAARVMDARAKNWAARRGRTAEEWWETRFGEIRSSKDMRKVLKDRKKAGKGPVPEPIDKKPSDAEFVSETEYGMDPDYDPAPELDYGPEPEAPDIEPAPKAKRKPKKGKPVVGKKAKPVADVDLPPEPALKTGKVDADTEVEIESADPPDDIEPPLDMEAIGDDAPPYEPPVLPEIKNYVHLKAMDAIDSLSKRRRRRDPITNEFVDYPEGQEYFESIPLDYENPGHAPEFLYRHMLQFDQRVDPTASTKDVAVWLSKHGKNPATRLLAARIAPLLSGDTKFLIADNAGTGPLLSYMLPAALQPSRGVLGQLTTTEGSSFLVITGHPGIRAPSRTPGKYEADLSGMSDQTILHELLHDVTIDSLAETVPVSKETKRVKEEILSFGEEVSRVVDKEILRLQSKGIQNLTPEELDALHGAEIFRDQVWSDRISDASKASELVSYCMTSPLVQRFLRGVEITKVLTPGDIPKTYFSKFVNLMSQLLGALGKAEIPPHEITALDRALRLSDELLTSLEDNVVDVTKKSETSPATTKSLSEKVNFHGNLSTFSAATKEDRNLRMGLKGLKNTVAGRKAFQKAIGGKSAPEACRFLIDNLEDAAEIKIAERILPHLSDDVRISVFERGDLPALVPDEITQPSGSKGAARGLFQINNTTGEGTIFLRGAQMQGTGITAPTVLHELIHAATASRVKAAKKAPRGSDLSNVRRDLARLRKELSYKKRPAADQDLLGTYSDELLDHQWAKILADPQNGLDELIAYGLTDKSFQDYLKTVKIEGQTVFNKFVTAIADLLGIPRNETNALAEIVRLTDELLDTPAASVRVSKEDSVRTLYQEIPATGVVVEYEPFYSALEEVARSLPDRVEIKDLIGQLKKRPVPLDPKAGRVKQEELTYTLMDELVEDLTAEHEDTVRRWLDSGDVPEDLLVAGKEKELLDFGRQSAKKARKALQSKAKKVALTPEEQAKLTQVEEVAASATVTREEVLTHIRENRVEIRETMPGRVDPEEQALIDAEIEAFRVVEKKLDDLQIPAEQQHGIYANPEELIEVFVEKRIDRMHKGLIRFLSEEQRIFAEAIEIANDPKILYSPHGKFKISSLEDIPHGPAWIETMGEVLLRLPADRLPAKIKNSPDFIAFREGTALHPEVVRLTELISEGTHPRDLFQLMLSHGRELSEYLEKVHAGNYHGGRRGRRLENGEVPFEEGIEPYVELRDDLNALINFPGTDFPRPGHVSSTEGLFSFLEDSSFKQGYEARRALKDSPEWQTWRRAKYVVEEQKGTPRGPHYAGYTTGNNKNYREILLQVPKQKERRTPEQRRLDKELERRLNEAARSVPGDEGDQFRAEVEAFDWFMAENPGFRPLQRHREQIDRALSPDPDQYLFQDDDSWGAFMSHNWDEARTGVPGGYPNVFVHIRTRDITDKDGNKVLFVEEIQSDWHQEGRVKGYSEEENDALREKFKRQRDDLLSDVRKTAEGLAFEVYQAADGEYGIVMRSAEGESKLTPAMVRHMWPEIEEVETGFAHGTFRVFDKEKLYRGVPYHSAHRDLAPEEMNTYLKEHFHEVIEKPDFYSDKKVMRALDALDPSSNTDLTDSAVIRKIRGTLDDINDKISENGGGHLPDAPFKKTWPEVAVRRILHLAQQGGYDSVAFTKGKIVSLLVGGDLAGQRRFYDELLPGVVEQEIKKVGGKIERRRDLNFEPRTPLGGVEKDELLDMLKGRSYTYKGKTEDGKTVTGRLEVEGGRNYWSPESDTSRTWRTEIRNLESAKAKYVAARKIEEGAPPPKTASVEEKKAFRDQKKETRERVARFDAGIAEARKGLSDALTERGALKQHLEELGIVDDVVITSGDASSSGVTTVRLTPEVSEAIEPGRPLFHTKDVEGVPKEVAKVDFLEDGRAIITALEKEADFTSVMHEIGHIIRRDMDPEELDEIQIWLKGEPHNFKELNADGTVQLRIEGSRFVGSRAREAEELFANSFVSYVQSQVAPTKGMKSVFTFTKEFMARVYAMFKGDPDFVVNPALSGLLDKMLSETPSEGVLKNSIRAARHSLRGTKEATTGKKSSFHEFNRTLKDKPIGVNAELGAVSASARISEEVTRLLAEGQSAKVSRPAFGVEGEVVDRLAEGKSNVAVSKDLSQKIEDTVGELIAAVSENRISKDDAVLNLPVKIMHNRFPGGKDQFTLDEIVKLQNDLEVERAEALLTTSSSEFMKGRQEAIQELTPVDMLRQFTTTPTWKNALQRGWLFTMFGGDSAYVGKASLRKFPPSLRAQLNSAGTIIEEAYGNMIRLIDEGDWNKVSKFLAGNAVSFKFGGRAALASGHNAFGDISDQMRRILSDTTNKFTDKELGSVSLDPDETLATLNGVFDEVDPSAGKVKFSRDYFVELETRDSTHIAAAQTIRKVFGMMDPGDSSSFTRDVGEALGFTEEFTSQHFVFSEALFYYTGLTTRKGKSVLDQGKSTEEIISLLLDETEKAFGGGEAGMKARTRVSVLMAGHGQTNRTIYSLRDRGLVFDQEDWHKFLNWTQGETVDPKDMVAVKNIARKAGMNPGLIEEPLLEAGVMLPALARKRISEALARGQVRLETKAADGKLLVSEADISNFAGNAIRYMKLRMTRGAAFIRQRYFFMNTIDHFSQMAMYAGFRPAVVSSIRVVAQDVMVLPGVARVLALVDKGSPGAMEKFRRVLQSGGDKTARLVGKLLGVSKYRVDLNDILDGKDGYIRLGGKVYSNRQVRDIMVQEGIFASFDTRALSDVIKRTSKDGYVKAAMKKNLPKWVWEPAASTAKTADDLVFKTVTDVAEAWSDRERAGAVLTMIESGLSPRAACRVTIDALYDYAGSMSKLDRSWIMSLLFPFWAFQKNANRQVFNLMFSPAGAYRMNMIRRATTDVPEFFTQLLWTQMSEDVDGVPTPYGLHVKDMTAQQKQTYYMIVDRLENGYGSVKDMDEETKTMVLNSYGVASFDELKPEQIKIIEQGYGPAWAMPEETREAIKALFADSRTSRVVGGKLLLTEDEGLENLVSQTGLAVGLFEDGSRRSPKLDEALGGYVDPKTGEKVGGLREFAFPDMSPSGQRSYLKGRGRIPVPPVFNKNTRQYYETMRQLGIDTPYLEWVLPDSTINAGFRHIANLNAFYILSGYKVKEWMADSPGSVGVDPLIPLEEVLDIKSTPIPGLTVEMLSRERAGYPRRIHPFTASLIETYIPGLSVLRIDAKTMQDSKKLIENLEPKEAAGQITPEEQQSLDKARASIDPWEDAESMTFASDEEYNEYLNSNQRTLLNERTYLPPGMARFLIENSPFGEFDRIMMSLPTKIPFTDVTFLQEADYRSTFQKMQDEDQLLQWAKFLAGADIQETTPTRTARIEERRIPEHLR